MLARLSRTFCLLERISTGSFISVHHRFISMITIFLKRDCCLWEIFGRRCSHSFVRLSLSVWCWLSYEAIFFFSLSIGSASLCGEWDSKLKKTCEQPNKWREQESHGRAEKSSRCFDCWKFFYFHFRYDWYNFPHVEVFFLFREGQMHLLCIMFIYFLSLRIF